MNAPNLCALVGESVAQLLMDKAGGLPGLAKLTDNAMRHVGSTDADSVPGVKQLCAGYLCQAPLFVEFFGHEEIRGEDLKAARKGLALLSRKCTLMVRADSSGGAPDGSLGASERVKLSDAFARLQAEGKVNVIDTQALPVPEVHKRGEVQKRRRGGVKEFKRREAQRETPGIVERAVSHIKMGVSEEEQREALLQRIDLQREVVNERETDLQRVQAKRNRTEAADDPFEDLMRIVL